MKTEMANSCGCGCQQSNDDSMFNGTKGKYLVEINSPGFDMATDNFDITLKRGQMTKVLHKSDLVHEVVPDPSDPSKEINNFYLRFDSAEFGNGSITVIVHAYVPDSDFEGGIRDEIDKFTLTNVNAV